MPCRARKGPVKAAYTRPAVIWNQAVQWPCMNYHMNFTGFKSFTSMPSDSFCKLCFRLQLKIESHVKFVP